VIEDPPLDPAQRELVRERLGREPRGLRAIAAVDEQGLPRVIRVASLVEGKPFPTLFWLIDPGLCLRIDREEAGGTIADLQRWVDGDTALKRQMARDHARHIDLRDAYLRDEERSHLSRVGQLDALRERGIGGIANFSRIRCLHTWYAAHLVERNVIGALLDERWGRDTPPG